MEAQPATEPETLVANLRDLAMALCADDDQHPLLELAEDASSFMVTLMEKDPGHRVDEKRYREFYSVVQNIVRLFETQRNTNPPPIPARFRTLGLIKMKRKLKKKFKKASEASTYQWEKSLIFSGRVVSSISTIPGLALLKHVGAVLGQIGDLIKTMHGNKDECAALLHLASSIIGDLSAKMRDQGQEQRLEPTEAMKQHVRDFERTLIHIRDHMTKLERKSRAKRFWCLIFANATKEDLARFRRDLMDAQTVFTTSNVYATRLEVHNTVQKLDDTRVKCDSIDAQLVLITSHVRATRLEVHNAVQKLDDTRVKCDLMDAQLVLMTRSINLSVIFL